MNLDLLNIINHQPVTIKQVRYNFNEVMEAILYLGQKFMPISSGEKKFILEEERLNLYTQLIYYFFNDDKFKGDLGKGLFIHGGKGTGKTLALKIFRALASNRLLLSGKGFRMFNCDEIVADYETSGAKCLSNYYKGNIFFDDIGDENRQALHYGTTRNVMKDIMTRRYREFTDNGSMTYITSNFNVKLIEQEYGARIEDRFKEMFNELILTGESLRK
ncbi:MAG: hypothetical protein HY841_13840 [Bacteroidetes bacterium]|nr:hypothetical protein [Bacteroidota bacterium]